MKFKLNWDTVGIGTSVLCAIHCALLPLLVTSLSLFGIEVIHNSWFEWSMIGLAFIVGSYALFHGYRTHHKNPGPLYLFGVGFACLVCKQFFHAYSVYFLSVAVACIITAHYINLRLCHKSKCSSPHHLH